MKTRNKSSPPGNFEVNLPIDESTTRLQESRTFIPKPGVEYTAQQIKAVENDQEFIDYVIENDIMWTPKGIVKYYEPSGNDSMFENALSGGYPIIGTEGNFIKLESAFGGGVESYVLCKSASITQ